MRLARRGLAGAALPTEVVPSARANTASVVPIFLLQSTIRAALRLLAQGVATARTVGLSNAVAAAMQLAKLKGAAAVLLAACVLGAGTTFLSPQNKDAPSRATQPPPPPQAAKAAAPERPNDVAKEDAKPVAPPEKVADAPRPPDQWQAHPFPQQPAERKAVPTNDADPSGMMDG